MPIDRYLKRRRGRARSGERWYLVVPVPLDLRPRFGRTIERALHTDSLMTARKARDEMLPGIRAMFDTARATPTLEAALPAIRRTEMARAHVLWSRTIAERGLATARQLLPILQDDDDDEPRRQRARRVLLQYGLEDDAIERVAEELLDAQADGAEMALEGRVPQILPQVAPDLPRTGAVPMADMLAAWERERRPSRRSALEFKRAMDRLAEHVGHGDGRRLTRDDIAGFRDALLGRVAAKSAFNALACVRAVLGVAVSTGRLAGNPASGVTVKTERGRRLPFDDAEAALILTAARSQRGGRRWVPWLLAFTGARLEEVCQADVSDIRQHGRVWFLDINADGPGKTLKNPGSARKVPLHPALIAEGFLAYAASIGSGSLFPDFNPDTFGRRGGTATKVLGRALRKLGITDPRKVAGHSWRHRFKDVCRGAGIEKAVHDALTGHSSGDVGDGYGLGYPLPVLAAAIDKLPTIGD